MNRFKGHRGMSLVEATIILLVLMLLTGVISPSIFDFVNDARAVKVKEDCEVIGVSVARLVRDIGRCIMFDGRLASVGGPSCTITNRVDMLVSDGPVIVPAALVGDALTTYAPPPGTTQGIAHRWDTLVGGFFDTLEHQLVSNQPLYPTLATNAIAGFSTFSNPKPVFSLGWRGAYLQSPVMSDPWGRAYVVNTLFLAVAVDATPGVLEGQRSGGWSRTVFCLSAGSNQLYETAYGGTLSAIKYGVDRGGDDYFYPISGSTR